MNTASIFDLSPLRSYSLLKTSGTTWRLRRRPCRSMTGRSRKGPDEKLTLRATRLRRFRGKK